MVLSIDDLRVDSYATQLSEIELTEVKGGATPALLGYVAVAALVTAVGAVAVAVVNANSAGDNDHKECDTQTTVTTIHNADGSTTTITNTYHICNENK